MNCPKCKMNILLELWKDCEIIRYSCECGFSVNNPYWCEI